MSVAIVNARAHDWNGPLGNHRLSSLFSSPGWIEVISRTYGIDVLASIADTEAGQGAILFSHIRDIRGDRLVCLPFSDYCDPLVGDAGCWREWISPLLLLEAPIRLRCLRNPLPAQDARFSLCRRAKWHAVDLTRPEEELWSGLSGQARQNIRRARQSGVVIREGISLQDTKIFHRMHSHVRKTKYRLLAQPFAFFENLHEVFSRGNQLTVLIAEHDGVPIAGIFLLQWHNVLYYKFNASIDQRFRPNDLLAWHAMLLGHRRKLAMLDFGLSEVEQEGLVRYKRKFATEERDICFFEWLPEGRRDNRGEEVSEILGRMTELFTDPTVPDPVTQAAGDEFYHLFA
jgi:hypothetical protein